MQASEGIHFFSGRELLESFEVLFNEIDCIEITFISGTVCHSRNIKFSA